MIERKVEGQEIKARRRHAAAATSSTSSALKKSLETAAQQRRRKKFESCARCDLPRGWYDDVPEEVRHTRHAGEGTRTGDLTGQTLNDPKDSLRASTCYLLKSGTVAG
jgi:hypothetical protein